MGYPSLYPPPPLTLTGPDPGPISHLHPEAEAWRCWNLRLLGVALLPTLETCCAHRPEAGALCRWNLRLRRITTLPWTGPGRAYRPMAGAHGRSRSRLLPMRSPAGDPSHLRPSTSPHTHTPPTKPHPHPVLGTISRLYAPRSCQAHGFHLTCFLFGQGTSGRSCTSQQAAELLQAIHPHLSHKPTHSRSSFREPPCPPRQSLPGSAALGCSLKGSWSHSSFPAAATGRPPTSVPPVLKALPIR